MRQCVASGGRLRPGPPTHRRGLLLATPPLRSGAARSALAPTPGGSSGPRPPGLDSSASLVPFRGPPPVGRWLPVAGSRVRPLDTEQARGALVDVEACSVYRPDTDLVLL
ncbi:DUF6233 domain-containing protein (plasmid) [Streptomyces albidoflavus]